LAVPCSSPGLSIYSSREYTCVRGGVIDFTLLNRRMPVT
jgi:hypothetical protein